MTPTNPPPRVRLEPTSTGFDVIRLSDDVSVGSAIIETDDEGPWIATLCIALEHRGYGAGSEAAWHITQHFAQQGTLRLRAWAPPDIGLAVYFWSRMGFRPLHGPGPNGGIWFERSFSPYAGSLSSRKAALGTP